MQYYCAIVQEEDEEEEEEEKKKKKSSSLHQVVVDTKSKHTVYPWHFSNAKWTLALLTLSLSSWHLPTTLTHSLTDTPTQHTLLKY